MGNTFELKDDAARKGLAETISWCAGLEIIADVEEPGDARFQRETAMQAGKLIQRACMERNSFWNRFFRRDYVKSGSFRRGAELYRQGGRNSSSLEKQLRPPPPSPTPN